MANKRYDQFPAGTYDPTKIFLQADPLTGALEKVNLPTIPTGLPYTLYNANLSQSGTSNPTVNLLVNNSPYTVAITRNAPGQYFVIFSPTLNINNIFYILASNRVSIVMTLSALAANTLQIITKSGASQVDNCLSNTSIEIRFY